MLPDICQLQQEFDFDTKEVRSVDNHLVPKSINLLLIIALKI